MSKVPKRCRDCYFLGEPRDPRNLGRCLLVESKKYGLLTPIPRVKKDCPYYLSLYRFSLIGAKQQKNNHGRRVVSPTPTE